VADLELKVTPNSSSSSSSSSDDEKVKTLAVPAKKYDKKLSGSKIGEEVAKLKKIVKGLNEELKSGLRPLIDQMFIDITNLNSIKGQIMRDTQILFANE
jgi:uncharacterized FlaG/YvyC family protein